MSGGDVEDPLLAAAAAKRRPDHRLKNWAEGDGQLISVRGANRKAYGWLVLFAAAVVGAAWYGVDQAVGDAVGPRRRLWLAWGGATIAVIAALGTLWYLRRTTWIWAAPGELMTGVGRGGMREAPLVEGARAVLHVVPDTNAMRYVVRVGHGKDSTRIGRSFDRETAARLADLINDGLGERRADPSGPCRPGGVSFPPPPPGVRWLSEGPQVVLDFGPPDSAPGRFWIVLVCSGGFTLTLLAIGGLWGLQGLLFGGDPTAAAVAAVVIPAVMWGLWRRLFRSSQRKWRKTDRCRVVADETGVTVERDGPTGVSARRRDVLPGDSAICEFFVDNGRPQYRVLFGPPDGGLRFAPGPDPAPREWAAAAINAALGPFGKDA